MISTSECILGVNVSSVTNEQAKKILLQFVKTAEPNVVVTPNPEFVLYAQKDAEFMTALNKADLAVPDGVGLLVASRLLNYVSKRKGGLPERVSGADLVAFLAETSSKENLSWFIVGRAGGLASPLQLKEGLESRFPDLNVVGACAVDTNSWDGDFAVGEVKKASPNIVMVSLGFPYQEKWMHCYADNSGAKLLMGVGGSLDFLTGYQKRAPRWLRRVGLEWFWRLITRPRRMLRIFNATLGFMWKILQNAFT